MGKVKLSGIDTDHKVAEAYSDGKGPVLRSDRTEVARTFFVKGTGSQRHSHPEEQVVFVEEGRIQVSLGEDGAEDTYVVEPGQASFHPRSVPHRMVALEDSRVVSFKTLVEGLTYGQAGRLS
ncbi:MAG: cupin domain-containing protein [Actinomycetota bacterium]|nr:cupin domain-containing protein [Actinomycetota bacterium]